MSQFNYDQEVERLLCQCGIAVDVSGNRTNVSLHRITCHFGIEYREKPLDDDMGGAWLRSLSTEITPHYIYVNSRHGPTRKRFSYGHEIGHFWLGHESDWSLESNRDQDKEAEANAFSAALNMPMDALYAIHHRSRTIKQIANWFCVSQIAAAFRLKNASLRPEEAEMVILDYRSHSDTSDSVIK